MASIRLATIMPFYCETFYYRFLTTHCINNYDAAFN